MKFNFTKLMLLAVCVLAFSTRSSAIIYTASTSGNFSSTATWGGTVPPTVLGANDIVINPGVTVTLDRSVTLSNTNSVLQLKGNGKIVSGGKYYLALNNGFFAGGLSNSVEVDSLHIGSIPNGQATFAGTISTRSMSMDNADMSLNIEVTEVVRFIAGANTFSGGGFTIATGGSHTPVIVFDGGTFAPGVGNIQLTNTYNVRYKDASAGVGNGWELGGTGLQDIEFDLGTGTLNLAASLNISGGKLMLTSGTVKLNSNNLTISGSSTVDPAGTGLISTDANSDITISSTATNLGELRLHFSDNTIGTFTMNTNDPAAELKIGSDMTVATILDLQSGIVNIQGNKLTMAASTTATINGGSASSYVRTEAGGELVHNIPNGGSTIYPVGHGGGYSPVAIMANSMAYNEMGVNVAQGVLAHATTGNDLATNQPLVDATWMVSYSQATGIDYDLELMWDAALEVNSFDRSKCFVTTHVNNDWDTDASGAATMNSGMYARKRAGLTETGSFAVFDENTVGIKDIAAHTQFNIYPNPANNVLNIEMDQTGIAATVYNTAGQSVLAQQLRNGVNQLQTANLPAGVYYLQLTGDNVNETTKFVKQ